MSTIAEQIRQAARDSLSHGWIGGLQRLSSDGRVTLEVRFRIDVARRATTQEVVFFFRDTPDGSRSRAISEGNNTYLPSTPGDALPAAEAKWVMEDFTGFTGQAPVAPLLWLLGATLAEPTGAGFSVTISQEAAVAAIHAEDREPLMRTWGIYGQLQESGLPARAAVELSASGLVTSISVTSSSRGLDVDYDYLDAAPEIEVPTSFTFIGDLTDEDA